METGRMLSYDVRVTDGGRAPRALGCCATGLHTVFKTSMSLRWSSEFVWRGFYKYFAATALRSGGRDRTLHSTN